MESASAKLKSLVRGVGSPGDSITLARICDFRGYKRPKRDVLLSQDGFGEISSPGCP